MKSTKKPKFLVVQFAPGGAGQFLISLLMGSDSVAHFDPVVNQDKTIDNCSLYIEQHFTKNIGDWIKHEPSNIKAWNLHFISNKYSRGHDMSYDQFIAAAQQDATLHFWEQVNNEKMILTPWHKTYVPAFYSNAKIITILIDDKAKKWFHRALWLKLYGVKDGKIHLKLHDPVFNPPVQNYIKKFNNPMYSDERFFSFVKREILKNQFKKEYQDSGNFETNSNRVFINLSELLNIESCINVMSRVCQELDIAITPDEIVRRGHEHWSSCHNFKYNTV